MESTTIITSWVDVEDDEFILEVDLEETLDELLQHKTASPTTNSSDPYHNDDYDH
jgi:hypothetical protein